MRSSPLTPSSEVQNMTATQSKEMAKFPESSDLDYPEEEILELDDSSSFSDMTLISKIGADTKQEQAESLSSPLPILDEHERPQRAAKSIRRPPPRQEMTKKRTKRDDRYLFVLIFIFVVLLGFIFKKYFDIFDLIGAVIEGRESYAARTIPAIPREQVVFHSEQGQLLSKAGISGITFAIRTDEAVDRCLFFERAAFPIKLALTESKGQINGAPPF